MLSSPPGDLSRDVCVRCHKTINHGMFLLLFTDVVGTGSAHLLEFMTPFVIVFDVSSGLVIRLAQSYHSSCFEAASKEGEEDKLEDFSNYVNLQVEDQTWADDDSFAKYAQVQTVVGPREFCPYAAPHALLGYFK